MKKYVLIASTGNQDIKFWLTGTHNKNGKKLAAAQIKDKINKSKDTTVPFMSVREVHQQLIDEKIPYEFYSQKTEEENSITHTITNSRVENADIGFSKSNDPAPQLSAYNLDNLTTIKQDGKYSLYAAKLDSMIETLKQKHQNKEIEIVGGLFLGTNRPGDNREPIASHILLAEYFASQFKETNGKAEELPDQNTNSTDCRVFWANQTKDIKNQKNSKIEGTAYDYPVRRVIARRIDDSIKKFLAYFPAETNVILSDTGGMPMLKAIVTASVKFRAPSQVLESNESEKATGFDTTAFDDIRNNAHIVTRHESLNIRKLVEDRILQGDFFGAWSVCTHLHSAEKNSQDMWTYAVQIVKSYMAGESSHDYPDTACLTAELEKLFRDLQEIINELTGNGSTENELTTEKTFKAQIKTTLTRTLFSIEAALQSTRNEEIDVKTALVNSATLSDQLLRACVFIYLHEHREDYSSFNENFDFSTDEVLKHYNTTPNINHKATRLVGEYRKHWQGLLKNHDKLKVCIDYQKRMNMSHSTKKSLQYYRNTISHGVTVDETLLNDILEVACCSLKSEHLLWNKKLLNKDKLPTIGKCFLKQHYVHEIEKSLGYKKNSRHKKYKKLQDTLLKIIRSSIYIPKGNTN